ncbi:MAG: response regulator transcription factor [Treponema sp.]|nr:response regulator transcription factor [Treponema sp.]
MTKQAMQTILIVEDDILLNEGIVLSLRQANYRFVQCRSLREARECWRQERWPAPALAPALIILDINLPDGSGLSWCRELRAASSVPVLMLTARDTELDIVTGLESGADDYLTKPFSLAVLRARTAALLRRGGGARRGSITAGPFSLDFDAMVFARDGRPLELSRTEQRLLKLLVMNPGQTIPRERLIERGWQGAEYLDENALSVTIRRLREKLEDEPGRPVYIKTVYGQGYLWAAPF